MLFGNLPQVLTPEQLNFLVTNGITTQAGIFSAVALLDSLKKQPAELMNLLSLLNKFQPHAMRATILGDDVACFPSSCMLKSLGSTDLLLPAVQLPKRYQYRIETSSINQYKIMDTQGFLLMPPPAATIGASFSNQNVEIVLFSQGQNVTVGGQQTITFDYIDNVDGDCDEDSEPPKGSVNIRVFSKQT